MDKSADEPLVVCPFCFEDAKRTGGEADTESKRLVWQCSHLLNVSENGGNVRYGLANFPPAEAKVLHAQMLEWTGPKEKPHMGLQFELDTKNDAKNPPPLVFAFEDAKDHLSMCRIGTENISNGSTKAVITFGRSLVKHPYDALHVLGHVLGFVHEHGGFVKAGLEFDFAELHKVFGARGLTDLQVKKLMALLDRPSNNGGSVDETSIMQFWCAQNAFRGRNTILRNKTISAGDRRCAVSLYPLSKDKNAQADAVLDFFTARLKALNAPAEDVDRLRLICNALRPKGPADPTTTSTAPAPAASTSWFWWPSWLTRS